MKQPAYVYMLASTSNRVLYVGVTTNLGKRVFEHKQHIIEGFTQKYNVNKLVYFEVHDNIELAIQREKQLKAGSREKKLRLIEVENPTFEDLYPKLMGVGSARLPRRSAPRNDDNK